MGGKESKHFPITYDDAVKRVSETEKRRLQDAFRRSSGTNSNISKQVRTNSIPLKMTNVDWLIDVDIDFTCRPSSRRFWARVSPPACQSRSSAWWGEGEESPSGTSSHSSSSSPGAPGRRSSNVSSPPKAGIKSRKKCGKFLTRV